MTNFVLHWNCDNGMWYVLEWSEKLNCYIICYGPFKNEADAIGRMP